MQTQDTPGASTSAAAAAASPSQNSLKRKDREEEDDEEKKDEEKKEEEVEPWAPWRKKPKKEKKVLVRRVVEKKIAVWKDIREWQEGDDPLGRFPVEILDQIISIDSDLDLRDHLALAGTCRYFRTCYRDVVLQVLFHSKNPRHHLPSQNTSIDSEGRPDQSSHSFFIGPVQRSWNEARQIFSSSAIARDGWGVANDEWENSDEKAKQDKERRKLVKLLQLERDAMTDGFKKDVEKKDADTLKDWTSRKEVYDAAEKKKTEEEGKRREEFDEAEKKKVEDALVAGEVYVPKFYSSYGSGYGYGYNYGPGDYPTPEGDWGVKRRGEAVLEEQIALYGNWVSPSNHVAPPTSNPRGPKSKRPKLEIVTARDPWESAWRYLVADVVGKPRITKTNAIRIYKVNEKELAALPMRHQTWKRRQKGIPRYYIKSSVEALSLFVPTAESMDIRRDSTSSKLPRRRLTLPESRTELSRSPSPSPCDSTAITGTRNLATSTRSSEKEGGGEKGARWTCRIRSRRLSPSLAFPARFFQGFLLSSTIHVYTTRSLPPSFRLSTLIFSFSATPETDNFREDPRPVFHLPSFLSTTSMSFTATSSILARSLGIHTVKTISIRASSTCSAASKLARTKLNFEGRAQHLVPSLPSSSSSLRSPSLSLTSTGPPSLQLPTRRSYHTTSARLSPSGISSSSDLSIDSIFLPPHSSSSKSAHSLHLKIDSPAHGIESSLFSARWIRDSDVSPVSVDQNTGQKRHRSSDVDDDIALKGPSSWKVIYPGGEGGTGTGGFEIREPMLRIDWEGTGMRSTPTTGAVVEKEKDSLSSFIPLSLLARQSHPNPSSESHPALPPVIPWTTATLVQSKTLFLQYSDFVSKESTLHAALTQLRTYGLVFLKGVPSEETSHDTCELKKLAGRLGELRHTFYGKVWDVKALGRKSQNVAYTNVDLGLHMDLLYFENPPRFQFLHSLRSLARGGNSYFVDSYRAASTLLQTSRSTFDYLTTSPIPYHYHSLSPPHSLSYSHPLISLSPFPPHQITHLNYSPPFQAPLNASDSVRMMDAMREFESELEKEEGRFELKLEKGDCVIFDNRRVLHARREFEETEGKEGEERWLKGCYVDGDAGWDTWRGLEEKRGREEQLD